MGHELTKKIQEAATRGFRPLVDYSPIEAMELKRDVDISLPRGNEFPQIIVTAPDSWEKITLAPLYDAHVGALDCDEEKLRKDIAWMASEPTALTWNGGDMWDNAIVASVEKPHSDSLTVNEQFDRAKELLDPIKHKMLFAIPGNHEARTTRAADVDLAKIFNNTMRIPYALDYMFCTIKWRGNNFHIMAHHGSGAAQTAGAQRNAARKDMPWIHVDLYWTGHLHQPLVDVVRQIDRNQQTNEYFVRDSVVIISPSYLNYFGGYGATKRLAPGLKGLTVATLQPDGRIDVSIHANGQRL